VIEPKSATDPISNDTTLDGQTIDDFLDQQLADLPIKPKKGLDIYDLLTSELDMEIQLASQKASSPVIPKRNPANVSFGGRTQLVNGYPTNIQTHFDSNAPPAVTTASYTPQATPGIRTPQQTNSEIPLHKTIDTENAEEEFSKVRIPERTDASNVGDTLSIHSSITERGASSTGSVKNNSIAKSTYSDTIVQTPFNPDTTPVMSDKKLSKDYPVECKEDFPERSTSNTDISERSRSNVKHETIIPERPIREIPINESVRLLIHPFIF
jgi:hypothetical protein